MAEEEQKCPECNEGAPEYMLTYGDMMTLLLCFFVLLLSMAEIDAKKFELAATSFQNALNGVLESMPTVAIHENVMRPKLGGDAQNKRIAAEVARTIQQMIKMDAVLKDAVKVEVTDKGIAVRISDPVGFAVGSDEIQPKFSTLLDSVQVAIQAMPERIIRVEGHTDNTPISNVRFRSNWELSAARGIAVVKRFHTRGENPEKLSAVGFGEYQPILPNTTDQNKRKNRRIEIFVEYKQENEDE